jgi:lysyl-tRNA synthetase class 2
MEEESPLIKIRKDKLREIREELQINPFPYKYEVADYSAEIIDKFDEYSSSGKTVTSAGRIMTMRVMGKASFCTIQDKDGRIQLYVAEKNIGDKAYLLFKKLDIGDIIGVKGTVRKTQVGEITIYISELVLLSKNIRPLPVVKEKDGEIFDAFADKELRYRNRHIDLIVTPGVKETFIKRTAIIRHIKKILDEKNYYEVETPILQPVYGGAAATPFTSHHKALDITLYLRISLEPYLKRLIVGGLDRVYEIGKCFRNEGIDRTHNPEFTMLELYQAYADFTDIMSLTEEIIEKTALAINGTTKIAYDGKQIDLTAPWRRLKLLDALKEYAGLDVEGMSDQGLEKELDKLGSKIRGGYVRGLAINELFKLLVEDKLTQPIFITHHPAETTPLCKPDYADERFIQRFELFINGTEIANAYSESNDPVLQRNTLYEQSKRRDLDEEAPPMDENFVQAIEAGMPPAGGLGIGIDRLVMLITGETSIRDVLLFPTMRPHE